MTPSAREKSQAVESRNARMSYFGHRKRLSTIGVLKPTETHLRLSAKVKIMIYMYFLTYQGSGLGLFIGVG
jgi:hypothetical protein